MKTLYELNVQQNGKDAPRYLAALVDNRLKSLDFELFNFPKMHFHSVEFLNSISSYVLQLFTKSKALKFLYFKSLSSDANALYEIYCSSSFVLCGRTT